MDKPLSGIAPNKIVQMGLAQCPEGRRIFQHMTVEENLEMGAYTRPNSTIEGNMAHVYDLFPRLKERRKQIGGTLSGGEQQMLAMGRAMMSEPKLLMLDEPSMGLAPLLVEQIFDIIRELHKAARLSCSSSRMRRWRSRWLTEPMFWRPARSRSAAAAMSCWRATRSKKPISAAKITKTRTFHLKSPCFYLNLERGLASAAIFLSVFSMCV